MARKATRNAQGGGTIRQRKDGTWEGRYTVGRDPSTGKQVQRSLYGKTQGEVRKKLQQATASIDDGSYIKPEKITVAQWLSTWFDTYFLPSHRASTASVYSVNITAYLIPALGDNPLQKLRVEQIQAFINKQNESKQPSSVHKMIEVLRAALKQAVANDLLAKSPCDGVIAPKMEQKEIEFLTHEEQKALLAALPDTDNARALQFILYTGLRVSEVCGLRWQDVKADHFTVRQGVVRTKVFKSEDEQEKTQLTIDAPKSKASMRTIPVTASADAILRQQRKLYAARRIAAGTAWYDGDFVFSSELGTPKDPANLRRTLKESLQKAGLKHRGVHALRHTFATNAILVGVDVKTLGELIGHTKAAFTIQTYVHSNMDAKKKAMEAIERL